MTIDGAAVAILLVEDDDAHAEIVRRNLSESRIANQIVRVADGQAALDYLHAGAKDTRAERPRLPDLVLLDLRLPKVDGLEVLRRIKQDERLKEIPVVVLTTSEIEADLIGAYQRGAASYLVKPVDFAKFTSLLATFDFYWLVWNRYPERT